jgi:hypothetical protein
MHGEQPLLRAQAVGAVAAGDEAAGGRLVGDEPVPALGVVVVHVDGGVDQVRVGPVAARLDNLPGHHTTRPRPSRR